ncbi:MAG: NmrA/HSCARG family protein [Azospirillaceae bacterium]|nr:NmrA/HSCARG family protein [Azospirillaceae bacterium]
MTIKSSPVLAIGASGKFGGLVIPELVKRGATVRGLIRDRTKADAVRRHGAAEVVVGDLSDRESLNQALVGVESVFYLAPAFLPHEAAVGTGLVEAAVQAGVRRFVFSSVIHPVLSALQNHAQKGPVEEAVLTSGMEYTFLHPTVFFQNFSSSWPQIAETGVLAEPWSIDNRFSRVDYRDVCEVAAIALTEDRLLYGTFELCAEGHLDRNDVAALIGQVLGRPVKAVRIDPEMAAAGAGPGAAMLGTMFNWYDQRGLLGSALTLRAILGREPRTLRTFFEELNAAFDPVRA